MNTLIFGSNLIKQGIPRPKTQEIYEEVDYEEYEEYVDPECGCHKIRVKKTKKEDYETNVKIQSEQVRTEDGTGITKTRRSKKS